MFQGGDGGIGDLGLVDAQVGDLEVAELREPGVGDESDQIRRCHDQDVVAGTFRELATMMADDGDETLLARLYGGAKEGSSRSEEAMLPGLFAMRSVALKPEGRSNERWASDLIHAVGEAFGDFYATWNGTATVKLARSETAGVLLVIDMGRPGDDDGAHRSAAPPSFMCRLTSL